MTYQVLARKWRPRDFSSLVGQDHVVRALTHALDQQRLHHAYLFTGTRGVGKTTLSRILAKALNCETGITSQPCGVCRACREIDAGRFVDYVEMDAASNRGVDEMAALLERAIYAPVDARFKVYMIDEVHMLTNHAFNAMLKTLEEPPAHVKFILATTDPQKIPVTVLSRCLQFNLKQMPAGDIVGHLDKVLRAEGIDFEPQALRLLSRAADGSMRDALSLTDQAIAYAAGAVNEEAVRGMLGAIDQHYLMRLLDGIVAGDGAMVLAVADEMTSRSLSFSMALQDLAQLLNRIGWAQFAPASVLEEWPEAAEIRRFAHSLSAEQVQLYYQIATIGRSELGLAPDEYAGFTMTLLRMLAFRPLTGASPVGGGELQRLPTPTPTPTVVPTPTPTVVPTPRAMPAVAPAALSDASPFNAPTAALPAAAHAGAARSVPRGSPSQAGAPPPAARSDAPVPAVRSDVRSDARSFAGSPNVPADVSAPAARAGAAARDSDDAALLDAFGDPFEDSFAAAAAVSPTARAPALTPAASPSSVPAADRPFAEDARASTGTGANTSPARTGPADLPSRASEEVTQTAQATRSTPSVDDAPARASSPARAALEALGALRGGAAKMASARAPAPGGVRGRAAVSGAAPALASPGSANAPRPAPGGRPGSPAPQAAVTADDMPAWDNAPWEDDGAAAFLSSAHPMPDRSGAASGAAAPDAPSGRRGGALSAARDDGVGFETPRPVLPPMPDAVSLSGVGFDEDWPALAARLDVKGLAQQLAFQSELVSLDGACLSLRIPMAQLASGPHVEKVVAALGETLGRPVELRIEIGKAERTAAVLEAARKAERQWHAEQSIHSDPFVQALLKEFDAAILPGSIQPLAAALGAIADTSPGTATGFPATPQSHTESRSR